MRTFLRIWERSVSPAATHPGSDGMLDLRHRGSLEVFGKHFLGVKVPTPRSTSVPIYNWRQHRTAVTAGNSSLKALPNHMNPSQADVTLHQTFLAIACEALPGHPLPKFAQFYTCPLYWAGPAEISSCPLCFFSAQGLLLPRGLFRPL